MPTLDDSGNRDLRHHSLVSRSVSLQGATTALAEARRALSAYTGLPPHYALARAKVAESEDELRAVTEEFENRVRGLTM